MLAGSCELGYRPCRQWVAGFQSKAEGAAQGTLWNTATKLCDVLFMGSHEGHGALFDCVATSAKPGFSRRYAR
jgi:hypothetical protein